MVFIPNTTTNHAITYTNSDYLLVTVFIDGFPAIGLNESNIVLSRRKADQWSGIESSMQNALSL